MSEVPSSDSGQVLYRKWRPQTFAEVAGQEAVTRTLRNSIISRSLAHAYLLCGPRGTGKTTLGRLLAKAANCASPIEGEPCNKCDSCAAFLEGRAMDFIEQDAASHNSVDDIRQLRENVVLSPMAGGKKVYLLDEVHMLSKGAYNALLKTLEEPPPHIIFVLATTDPHKVEPTIVSRCQRFDLRRIPMGAVVQRLAHICREEGYSLDEASLEEIARAATGSLRDAINGLQQVVTYYGPSPSFDQVQDALGLRVDARSGQLARLALAGDLAGGLKLIASVRDDGADMKQFSKQVAQHLRKLLLAKTGALEAIDLPREAAEELRAEAAKAGRAEIVGALRAFGKVDFRDDPQSSLPLELALIECVADGAPAAAPVPKPEAAAVAAKPERRVEVPVAAKPQPRVEPPAAPMPEVPATPKPEPRFSVPLAEMGEVASTVTSAVVDDTAPEEPLAEPELEPEPAAAASNAPGGDLLERVRQTAKETDKQLSALLNGSCEVKAIDGDIVVLGFYHTFHLERVETGPFDGRLDALFSSALGRPVKVALEHAPRAPRPQGPVKGGHLVQAAKEMGAKPVGRSKDGEGGQDG